MADPNLKKWDWDRFTTALDGSLRKAGQIQNPTVGQIEAGELVTVEWPGGVPLTTVPVGNRRTAAFLAGGNHDQTIRAWTISGYNLSVVAEGNVTAATTTIFWVF